VTADLRGSRPLIIFTEATPNPDALKFRPHMRLTDGASASFDRRDFEPSASPLAAALFEIAGVARVFVAADFVTVVREPKGPPWDALRYEVMAAMAGQLATDAPILVETEAPAVATDEIESEIRQVLGLHVNPAVARDGGDIAFDRFEPDTGVLWIRMQGACGGCPSARLTLKAGVEQLVRRYVPEVLRVEETPGESAPAEVGGARLKRWAQALIGKSRPAPPTVFTHNGRNVSPTPVRSPER
jgi:Fe-S cluster biogenesis protein NfuA